MTSNAPPPFKAKPNDILVIHHLSDLAFDQSRDHPLFDYFAYLTELEDQKFESAHRRAVSRPDGRTNGRAAEYENERPELPPNLVIITGNIAARKFDDDWQRSTLREAAVALRGPLQITRRDLHEAAFVVPGPLDVAWDRRASWLEPFARAFDAFATPFTAPTSSAGAAVSFNAVTPPRAHYAVYLLNTSPTPAELLALSRSGSKEFAEAIKAYDKALASYEKRRRRSRGAYDEELDRRLADKVAALLRLVEDGRVLPQDHDAFVRACNTPRADGDEYPLKILVTYHPLLTGREFMLPRQAGPTAFARVLELARQQGFHLAFQGHSARPQAFAELPLAGQQVPLRQIGSASLRATRSYNEIVATHDQQKHHWNIEMRTVPLPSQQALRAQRVPPRPIYIVLNPLADVLKPPTQEKGEATKKRERFEKEIRITMRLLAEAIESDSEEIPFPPLVRLQAVIQDVIFENYDTVVGLAIKTVHGETGRVELQSQYLDPAGYGDYRFTHPFEYPTTPPAWALILERILAFPLDFCDETGEAKNALTRDDREWLNATGKEAPTKERLYAYWMSIESDRELPKEVRERESARAKRLYERFASQGAYAGHEAALFLDDAIQHSEQAQTPLPFDEVVYVPVPRRPRGGFQSARTELGTLIIEVARRKDVEEQQPQPVRDQQQAQSSGVGARAHQPDGDEKLPQKREEIVTEDCTDMLRTVSDVMYLILATADRLGRPKGSWPHPRNGFR